MNVSTNSVSGPVPTNDSTLSTPPLAPLNDSHKFFLANVGFHQTAAQVKSFFERHFGPVNHVKLVPHHAASHPRKPNDGQVKHKGYGFLFMLTQEAALAVDNYVNAFPGNKITLLDREGVYVARHDHRRATAASANAAIVPIGSNSNASMALTASATAGITSAVSAADYNTVYAQQYSTAMAPYHLQHPQNNAHGQLGSSVYPIVPSFTNQSGYGYSIATMTYSGQQSGIYNANNPVDVHHRDYAGQSQQIKQQQESSKLSNAQAQGQYSTTATATPGNSQTPYISTDGYASFPQPAIESSQHQLRQQPYQQSLVAAINTLQYASNAHSEPSTSTYTAPGIHTASAQPLEAITSALSYSGQGASSSQRLLPSTSVADSTIHGQMPVGGEGYSQQLQLSTQPLYPNAQQQQNPHLFYNSVHVNSSDSKYHYAHQPLLQEKLHPGSTPTIQQQYEMFPQQPIHPMINGQNSHQSSSLFQYIPHLSSQQHHHALPHHQDHLQQQLQLQSSSSPNGTHPASHKSINNLPTLSHAPTDKFISSQKDEYLSNHHGQRFLPNPTATLGEVKFSRGRGGMSMMTPPPPPPPMRRGGMPTITGRGGGVEGRNFSRGRGGGAGWGSGQGKNIPRDIRRDRPY